jgi:hypothetical protein
VKILERTPERLRLEADAPDATWLFVLRGFFTYRTVLLDGKPVECFPAQLAFSAIRMPAGKHRVEWIERVPGGRLSRFGPVLFILIAIGIAFARPRGSVS